MTLAERFWAKVERGEGCWNWTAAKDPDGYGRIGIGGKYGPTRRAHRIAWELTQGDCGDMLVLHRCDNPSCVRPSHLFLGTHADNLRDCREKGRRTRKTHCPRGHEYVPSNIYIMGGYRVCKACNLAYKKKRCL